MESVTAVSQQQVLLYIQYTSIALVWYDYVLTLGQESRTLWAKPRKSWFTILIYVGLRYPLLGNTIYLLAKTHHLPNCDSWYKFIGGLTLLGRSSVFAVTTIRTYAIYNKNRLVLFTLGLIAFACMVLDAIHIPGERCVGSAGVPIVPTLLSIAVCIFEATAMLLLIFKVVQLHTIGGKDESGQNGSLTSFVLQQGLLYFCGVFAFQLSAPFLNFLAKTSSFSKLLNALTLPISCIFTARFLLDLWAFKESSLTATEQQEIGAISTLTWEVANRRHHITNDLTDSDTALGSATV